jgi:hypothetical protein
MLPPITRRIQGQGQLAHGAEAAERSGHVDLAGDVLGEHGDGEP